MKSTQRHTAAALGILALSLAGTTMYAQAGAVAAQRGGAPNNDTPKILVATFRSNDRALGVLMADETRKRIQGEHNAKELYAITKANINNTLEASGYRPDSALNASDLMELSKQLSGDQVLDGTVNKAGNGVHVEARLLIKANSQVLVQPLPPVDGKDPGDAAKTIEKSLVDAQKALPGYRKCTNDLRAAKFDEAATDARAALTLYPNSTFARLCLLTAFSSAKASPDSILSAANAVLAVDPVSMIALVNAAEAYTTKGDKDKAIEYQLRMYRADPTNTSVVTSLINGLAQSGAPDKALPMIDSLLINNPGDPAMLSTKWKLQRAAKQFKAALATGDELIKVDTAAATLDFYQIQIGVAQADSNAAMVQTLAAKAAQKFPKDAQLQMILVTGYRKAGQLQQAYDAARRVNELDPKRGDAWLYAVATALDLKMPDSALAIAPKAIAAGADKETIGTQLLQIIGASQQKAAGAKGTPDERAAWEATLVTAKTVDAVNATTGTQFFIGLASFQIALDAINHAQPALSKTSPKDKAERAKGCEETKVAEDMATATAIAMPRGGAYNKEAAAQILGALSQVQDLVPQYKKVLCTGK